MSETESTETNAETITSAVEGAAAETTTEGGEHQPINGSGGKPPGYDPVDVSGLPPEQQQAVKQRMDYLYRQVKDGTRTLSQYRQVAAEQSRQIEALTNATNSVVHHLQDKSLIDTEAQLSQSMREAYERGDNKAYIEAQNKLLDVKVKKELSTRQQPQQEPQQQKQNFPSSSAEIAQRAQDAGELGYEETQITTAWQHERAPSGEALRPWAVNKSGDPNNPDPEFVQALREAQAVFTNKRFEGYTYEQKLAEIDRRMGTPKMTTSQNVIGGGLTNGRKSAKITLTDNQRAIALKTRYGGPKAKSDAEHLEAYRKQIEKVQSAKGARK